VSGPRLIVEADGGSRGNPGPAGYGAVVRDADTGDVLAEVAEAIGVATNNVAEYRGLLAGLAAAVRLEPAAVQVRMDSKLVVEQMAGRWKVRHPDLAPLHQQALELVGRLPTVRFDWVPRDANQHADRLANAAMDAAAAGRTWHPAAQAPPVTISAPAAPGWSAPAAAPTSMLLLRHGETAHSVERRFSGREDLPLTARGLEQAEAAARRLSTWDGIVAVVSSPLQRARATADVVAAVVGAPVEVEQRLVETDFGAWEGLTFAEVQRRWPGELAAWLADPTVAPPDGESFAETARRVRQARDRTLARFPGQTVLVVSHVTPIKTLLRIALDAPSTALFRLHLDIGGLSIVDWYADGPASVRLVNDTSHLAT
jgi:probable phosphoglycerate mutase